jgi:FHS family L-fucose permease-like MFS transporter
MSERNPNSARVATPRTGDGERQSNPESLQIFVFVLFFVFGGITSLNDILIPKLKELFTLTYTEAMLIQFCFFCAYAAVGLPSAHLVKKIGYMRGAVVGLLLMMAGCLLFLPASESASYPLFLSALFVLASGVVLVQVVANPLISMLGATNTTHSRLTFAQAFNSLGTTLFPLVGSALIFGAVSDAALSLPSENQVVESRVAGAQTIKLGYGGLAMLLAAVAFSVWRVRNRLRGEQHDPTSMSAMLGLLRERSRFRFGVVCIFLYVGAEVAIGSIVVNFLMQEHVMKLTPGVAGSLVGLYWGGAMVGRFVGAVILRAITPSLILAVAAIGAIALLSCAAGFSGSFAGYCLLAIGLCNAIMFPTIFSIACEGLESRRADASGIMNVAIVGGAIIPLVTGVLADASDSLSIALLVPAICYFVIVLFGWTTTRQDGSKTQ